MARRIPRVADGVLYDQEPPGAPEIAVDSPVWTAWLEDRATHSFSFEGPSGTFTARKEHRSGSNEEYWSAYRKRGGKLQKVYLGKAEKLTLTRLDEAATQLSGYGEKVTASLPADATAGDGQSSKHADAAATEGSTTADDRGRPHPRQRTSSDPLLLTKLSVPSTRASLVVPRLRLSERLEEGLERKLTLLSAPAGCGKSTLLGAWVSEFSGSRPVAWLSLDSADNDPVRFWRYLVTAIDRLYPGAGDAALALLGSAHAPPIEAVLNTVLNELANLPTNAVLVLDDYHLIEYGPIHEALGYLIDHLPPRMHLVISTRADPSLSLARLRARGELNELRGNDLSFTSGEAAMFFTRVMGLHLSAEDVAELERRTEGWVAGLQLAALAMRDHADVAGFIASFTGSNRHVVDYLAEEVFERQPEALRAFLLETSILDRMCGPLCEAVTGHTNGQAVLERLERANLFMIPLDEQRQWYRYHHLFADVLRQRLRWAGAERLSEVHGRASEWFEQQDLLPEAVRHALEAPDYERAAHLIEQGGLPIMLQGQVYTVRAWIEALPSALVRTRPILCIIQAGALMFTKRFAAAEGYLQDAERCVQADSPNGRTRIMGQAAMLRASIKRLSGDLAGCVDHARRALDLLPQTAPERGTAMANASLIYQISGDVSTANERLVESAVDALHAFGDPHALLGGLTNLARFRVLQGKLRAAAAAYDEAAHAAPGRTGLRGLVNSSAYYVGLGDLLREWNDLDSAERHLLQGLDLAKGTLAVDVEVVALGFIAQANLHQARGEHDAAIAVLEEFVQQAQQHNFVAPLLARGEAARACVWLAQGDVAAAVHWAEESGLRADDEPGYPQEEEYLVLVRVLIAQARDAPEGPFFDEALRLIYRLRQAANSGAREGSAIRILILQALALHARRDTSGALAVLDQTLALAQPEGYVRVFVDEGAPMKALLLEFLKARRKEDQDTQHLPSLDYARWLLAAFEAPLVSTAPLAPGGYAAWQDQPLPEHLTAREREVLELIAEGLTNPEIAARLFIATSTVKWHIHGVFRKLDVDSRTRVVARARELHLISE